MGVILRQKQAQISVLQQGWDKYRKKIANTNTNTVISLSANTDTNTDDF